MLSIYQEAPEIKFKGPQCLNTEAIACKTSIKTGIISNA